MKIKTCTKCQRSLTTDNFHWANKSKGYLMSECKECNQARKKAWRKGIRGRNREKIKKYLGGEYRCNRCGFTHSTTSPFDWHHSGDDKSDNPMSMIHREWSVLKKELDKCKFLCANCHRIEHHG